MKIIHRIGLRIDSRRQQQLRMLGVGDLHILSDSDSLDPLVTFDLDEEHPQWLAIRQLAEQWGMSDAAATHFSDEEIATASWVNIRAWSYGYPEPHEDGSYRALTYDLQEWCPKCGQKKRQRAPFRMKGEPRWGKRGILQLFWVDDEIFVTPVVWATVFRPHGIASRPVLDRKGAELKSVVQIVIDEEVGVRTDDQASLLCPTCHRIKYCLAAGYYPTLTEEPRAAIARTREYFGSGGAASHFIIVSQVIVRALKAACVRGVTYNLFKPCDSTSDTAS